MRKKNPPVPPPPPPPPPMPRDLSGAKDFLYKNTTNFDIGNKRLQNRETLVCFFLYFLGLKHQFRDKSNCHNITMKKTQVDFLKRILGEEGGEQNAKG
jgi:hypothetical protein